MYFVEVYVEHVVLDGVELHFLDNGLVVNAVDVDVDQVDVGRVDQFVDVLFGHVEVDGYGSTVLVLQLSVQHARNITVLADFLGCFLAKGSAGVAADCNLLHLSFV